MRGWTVFVEAEYVVDHGEQIITPVFAEKEIWYVGQFMEAISRLWYRYKEFQDSEIWFSDWGIITVNYYYLIYNGLIIAKFYAVYAFIYLYLIKIILFSDWY
jgi:hypothetical protein